MLEDVFQGTYEEAKAAGAKYYYRGLPCPQGHHEGFYVHKERRCVACMRERANKWRADNPEKSRDIVLKTKFGINSREWDDIFRAQGNCCALCKTITPNSRKGWCIDHDYNTGKIRGIICHKCNVAIGQLEKILLPMWDQVQEYLNG
jgi:hypothetical protein